jgi:O-antigen/teichoic acid export membrane protein
MISKIRENEFLKNMMTLLSGSAIAQLIPFLLLPILQKWFYSPSQFGELALYTSVSMLLAQVAGFKYEFAIVKADTEKEASNILSGTFIIILVFTLVSAISFNLLPDLMAALFGINEIRAYFYLIPFSIFFFSSFELLNYWNNRKKNYKRIATAKVVKTLSAETTKLGLAFYHNSLKGLVIGRVIGEFVSFGYLAKSFISKDLKSFQIASYSAIWNSLKTHYRFPFFSMPSVFVGNLINLVFLSLFTSYFGTAKAGVIGISVVYVSMAFGLISQSFSQVFYKELSDTKGKKALLKLYLGNAKYLVIISTLAVIFVQLIPSPWVAKLLGEEWIDLMPTLKILVFAYAVSFISSSLSFIYMRVNKQKQMLLFDILHLALVSLSIYFAFHYYGTFRATLISYTIAQVVYYSFAFLIAIVFIRNSEN